MQQRTPTPFVRGAPVIPIVAQRPHDRSYVRENSNRINSINPIRTITHQQQKQPYQTIQTSSSVYGQSARDGDEMKWRSRVPVSVSNRSNSPIIPLRPSTTIIHRTNHPNILLQHNQPVDTRAYESPVPPRTSSLSFRPPVPVPGRTNLSVVVDRPIIPHQQIRRHQTDQQKQTKRTQDKQQETMEYEDITISPTPDDDVSMASDSGEENFFQTRNDSNSRDNQQISLDDDGHHTMADANDDVLDDIPPLEMGDVPPPPRCSLFHPDVECEIILSQSELSDLEPELHCWLLCARRCEKENEWSNRHGGVFFTCWCQSISTHSYSAARKHIRTKHGGFKPDETDKRRNSDDVERELKRPIRRRSPNLPPAAASTLHGSKLTRPDFPGIPRLTSTTATQVRSNSA